MNYRILYLVITAERVAFFISSVSKIPGLGFSKGHFQFYLGPATIGFAYLTELPLETPVTPVEVFSSPKLQAWKTAAQSDVSCEQHRAAVFITGRCRQQGTDGHKCACGPRC